ncbi:MAG: TetR/AcrR family transcriptional regulator [Candidatus Nanopelagicales bacterium]
MPKIVDHDARRAAYLDALWRVVERDGAQAVTVRSVAAEAGLSKSNLGYYFASQDALIAAAVRQVVESTAAELEDLNLADCTPAKAVVASLLVIPMTDERRRQAQVWLMLAAGHATDEAFAGILAELNAVVRSGSRMIVERLAACGYVGPGRNLELEAARLHALLDGLSLQSVTDARLMPESLVEGTIATHIEDLQLRPG